MSKEGAPYWHAFDVVGLGLGTLLEEDSNVVAKRTRRSNGATRVSEGLEAIDFRGSASFSAGFEDWDRHG